MFEFFLGFLAGIITMGVTAGAVIYFRPVPRTPSSAYEGPPTPARVFIVTL